MSGHVTYVNGGIPTGKHCKNTDEFIDVKNILKFAFNFNKLFFAKELKEKGYQLDDSVDHLEDLDK